MLDPWRDAVRAAAADPDERRVGIIRSFFVTDDPERDWPAIKESERYRMRVYGRFFAETTDKLSAFDRDRVSIPQGWFVGDVDACVAEMVAFVTEYGITDVVTWGAAPGLPPEAMNGSARTLRHRGRPPSARRIALV